MVARQIEHYAERLTAFLKANPILYFGLKDARYPVDKWIETSVLDPYRTAASQIQELHRKAAVAAIHNSHLIS